MVKQADIKMIAGEGMPTHKVTIPAPDLLDFSCILLNLFLLLLLVQLLFLLLLTLQDPFNKGKLIVLFNITYPEKLDPAVAKKILALLPKCVPAPIPFSNPSYSFNSSYSSPSFSH